MINKSKRNNNLVPIDSFKKIDTLLFERELELIAGGAFPLYCLYGGTNHERRRFTSSPEIQVVEILESNLSPGQCKMISQAADALGISVRHTRRSPVQDHLDKINKVNQWIPSEDIRDKRKEVAMSIYSNLHSQQHESKLLDDMYYLGYLSTVPTLQPVIKIASHTYNFSKFVFVILPYDPEVQDQKERLQSLETTFEEIGKIIFHFKDAGVNSFYFRLI